MNTADRSIRSIDIALRRRFDVFELRPDADVLERFYGKAENTNEVASLFDGFENLNDELTQQLDRHHTIGHTFFMAQRDDRWRPPRSLGEKDRAADRGVLLRPAGRSCDVYRFGVLA